MKKTQILSAIALAFALGVVAPIAVAENASAVTASTKEAVENDIADIKASFGTVTTYSGGQVVNELEGAAAYTFYAGNVGFVNDAESYVSDLKNASGAGSIADDIRTAIGDNTQSGTILYQLTAAQIPQTVKDILASANKWTSANLATTVSNAQVIANALKNSVRVGEADYDTVMNAAEAIEELIATGAINDRIKAEIMTDVSGGSLQSFNVLYNALVKNPTITIEDEASLNAAIAAVKAALPKIALYNKISAQITKIEKAIADNKSDATINGYLATLKKLVSGQITPAEAEKENADNDSAAGAPNTGIVGTAEGTATTVSIVAGLATALTALGAGVVAYRSARRK